MTDGDVIKQPRMLNCQLKEYQLKGLNWLANLYDQGINGILADEMASIVRERFAFVDANILHLCLGSWQSAYFISFKIATVIYNTLSSWQTVQSIALMAHLAEVENIWGPFLVIAPASTLHNWQQEISRFAPDLKALPYWGNVKDRTILRKFWNRKSLRYDKDAPFHVLVTSYQLVRLVS